MRAPWGARRPRGSAPPTRKLAWLAVPALLTAGIAGFAGPAAGHKDGASGPPDTYVAAWDAIAISALTAPGVPPVSPGDSHTIFAYQGIAIYDAVMAIEGGYEPFAVDFDAPAGASPQAAVVAAAHRILQHYLGNEADAITDSAYVDSLATIADGQAKTDGVATGEAVASQVIALRANDGFRAPVVPYVPPVPPVPGVWLPTASAPAIGLYFASMTPFSLRSANQFRPGGPPALHTKKWAADYNEVARLGSSTSTARTDEQTVVARFWGEAPAPQSHRAFREFMLNHELDIVDAARFMAMISVAFADSNIACFEAKYHYTFWRPITAIRAGDTDGNAATVGDPTWTSLLAAPNHPDYPSAHSCITPTAGLVMARFLGTKHIDFTIPSLTGLGDRHYDTPTDLTDEVGDARVWAGIHFRSAVDDGARLAKKVANWVLSHHFHRTSD